MARATESPPPLDEVETLKAAFLARAHGDLRAAYEMLALNTVATVREFEGLVDRHVSHGYVRARIIAKADGEARQGAAR